MKPKLLGGRALRFADMWNSVKPLGTKYCGSASRLRANRASVVPEYPSRLQSMFGTIYLDRLPHGYHLHALCYEIYACAMYG